VDRQAARLERWLDIVGELLREPLCRVPYDLLNAELADSFGVTAIAWSSRADDGRVQIDAWPSETYSRQRLDALMPTAEWQPLVRWYRTTGSTTPHRLASVPKAIADTRCVGQWREVSKPLGVTEQLGIPMYLSGSEYRALVVARADEDFTDADVELACRIQSVLIGVECQAAELSRWRSRVAQDQAGGQESGHAAATDARLTGREVAVLALLAEGLTAKGIGRRLDISEQTVNKHLQHIYAKLRTNDRLTTVLRAQQQGLLPELSRASGSISC
jgi:DNA-binding CsgD family transcriptional regulator